MKRAATVAIVGRPNVGKSTLFNRITQERRAIVHPTPGVTRDIQKGAAEWGGVSFELTDTGGLFSGIDDDLVGQVEKRAMNEALSADALLFVTDAQSGVLPADVDVAERLRGVRVPVFVVPNKAEKLDARNASGEFYELGFEHVYPVSSIHGDGVGDLLEDLIAVLPRFSAQDVEPDLKLAVVGVPNVGKSSLVNGIVGEDVNIVDERPGTTRDSIDIALRWEKRRITLVDTAGLKRKSRTDWGVDTISSLKSIESIGRCDVAILMLDATRKISNQDVRVGSYAHKEARGIVVCFNKWDCVEKGDKTYKEFEADFKSRFAYMSYAPRLFISALTRQRVNRVLETAWHVKEEREKRIGTADFNRFLEAAVKRNPPPHYGGGNGKVYYGTQVEVAPPTFSLFVNKREYFGRNYLRYLNNQIREAFRFDGTLIRISLAEKKRTENIAG